MDEAGEEEERVNVEKSAGLLPEGSGGARDTICPLASGS